MGEGVRGGDAYRIDGLEQFNVNACNICLIESL